MKMARVWFALETFLLVSGALLLGASAGAVGFSAWAARADRIAFERARIPSGFHRGRELPEF